MAEKLWLLHYQTYDYFLFSSHSPGEKMWQEMEAQFDSFGDLKRYIKYELSKYDKIVYIAKAEKYTVKTSPLFSVTIPVNYKIFRDYRHKGKK